MKKNILVLAALSITVLAFSEAAVSIRKAIDSIRSSDVRRHIDYLASDELLGRDTPSEGLDKAAAYIAQNFQNFGLQPVNGSYYHTFELNRVRLGEDNFVMIKRDGAEESLKIKREFMPYDLTGNGEASGQIVFAGYGITAPEYDYDDYDGLDVQGKLVVVLRHEPGEKDTTSVFEGSRNTPHAKLRNKVENAMEHGATGLLIITDPLNHRSLRPRGFPWPSLYSKIPNDAVPLTLVLTEKKKIPVVHVGKKFIRAAFTSVDSLKSLQSTIDATKQPKSFLISGMTAHVKTSTSVESIAVKNVVALLEGSDLKNELIILGAHYDHVGYLKEDVKPGEDYIINGADDNASGTVGLLEVAEAFSVGVKPRRSVLFIAFAGEEKGLLGSRAYVEDPSIALEDTRAMINMDMIGRNEGDHVTIIGFSKSPDLDRINSEENRYVGLKLEYNGERFFRRSDQYSFARKGIPVLFYNTDTHEDYHKVSDNPDKINEGKIAMISRLVFRTVWRAANTGQTFRYIDSNN